MCASCFILKIQPWSVFSEKKAALVPKINAIKMLRKGKTPPSSGSLFTKHYVSRQK